MQPRVIIQRSTIPLSLAPSLLGLPGRRGSYKVTSGASVGLSVKATHHNSACNHNANTYAPQERGMRSHQPLRRLAPAHGPVYNSVSG